VLAHLSESCNEPRLAADALRTALAPTRFRGAVTAAGQDTVLGPIAVAAARAGRHAMAQQLTLGL
jgi:hypothetical protein